MTASQRRTDALRKLLRRGFILTFFIHFAQISHIVQERYSSVLDDWKLPPTNSPGVARQPYHYLTYALVHDGWVHVCSNIVDLLVYGLVIECNHGRLVALILFLIGVIGGGLFYHGDVYLRGASGGTFALAGAAITNGLCWDVYQFYSHFRTTHTVVNDMLLQEPDQIARIGTSVVLVRVGLQAIVSTYLFGDERTAHSAHTGGLLVGAIGGLLMLAPICQRERSLYDLLIELYYGPAALKLPEEVDELEMVVLDVNSPRTPARMTTSRGRTDVLVELLCRCWITIVLALSILAAYFVQQLYPTVLNDWSLPPANSPGVARQLYHYLTYALVHSGWEHVWPNLANLFMYGCAIQLKHQEIMVPVVFFIGAAGGGLTYHGDVYLPGASRNTFALVGAAIANGICWSMHRLFGCFRTTHTTAVDGRSSKRFYQTHTWIPTGLWSMGLLAFVMTYLFGDEKISYSARAGGLVAGVIAGLLMLAPKCQRQRSLYDLLTKFFNRPVPLQRPETVDELEIVVSNVH